MQNKESLDYKKAKMESYQEQNRYTCLTSKSMWFKYSNSMNLKYF